MAQSTAGASAGVTVDDLPQAVKLVLTEKELAQTDFVLALTCKKCNSPAKTCTVAKNYSPGRCLILHCPNQRTCPNWFVCCVCNKRVDKRRVKDHFAKNKAHYKNLEALVAYAIVAKEEAVLSNVSADANIGYIDYGPSDDDNDDLLADTLNFPDAISALTEQQASIAGGTTNSDAVATVRKMTWLELAFQDLPVASMREVLASFGNQRNMALYFVANHQKHPIGGVQYLVTRVFHRNEFFSGLTIDNGLASEDESKWHFINFAQYISMGDKQRRRQAALTAGFASSMFDNSFFRATRVLRYDEMNRYYGKSNQHTLWNILPIPTVRSIDGIAYISPVNAIRFLLAFATEVDDFVVNFSRRNSTTGDQDSVVYHISQSREAKKWEASVLEKFQGTLSFQNGLFTWAIDWKDGFGSNRTKLQRKPTDGWTFSSGTPKDRINSIDNTIPIALGLKKNESWHKVQHAFREDMKQLNNGMSPLMSYHGGLRKVIPVFVRRVACMTDKVECAEYTSTLSCTSQLHRCFGKIIRFDPPKFDQQMIENYLKSQKQGGFDAKLRQYGWSHGFVESTKNGAKFAACYNCRKRNVDVLRQSSSVDPTYPLRNITCEECADWTLDATTKTMLLFETPKKYPTFVLPDCPVEAPTGREIGLEKMECIPLDFDTLKQAARFAFYNCCAK